MKRSISITYPHALEEEQARYFVDQACGQLAGHLGKNGDVSSGWNGNTLHVTIAALGQKAVATVQVTTAVVAVSASIPILLAPFAKQIEDMLASQADVLLGRSDQKFRETLQNQPLLTASRQLQRTTAPIAVGNHAAKDIKLTNYGLLKQLVVKYF